MTLHPGVEGGLGLFEQSDVFEAGLFGGFEGELARHGVEGSRHRDQGLLRGERGAGHLGVPGMAQIFQVAAGSFEGRDLLHAVGSAKGQQCGGAVHAGVRKPRFGRGDQPSGILHAALLCQTAGDEAAGLIPGQGDGSRREIGGTGQVQERRQQVFVAHFTGIH